MLQRRMTPSEVLFRNQYIASRGRIERAAADLTARKQQECQQQMVAALDRALLERAAAQFFSEANAVAEALSGESGPTPVLAFSDQPGLNHITAIQRLVCARMNIRRNDLLSARRFVAVVRARQIGMYLCRLYTSRSYPEIGRRFGDRDHTTVLHGCKVMEAIERGGHGEFLGRITAEEAAELRKTISELRAEVETW